ncbi:MAG: 5'/3'-nucleotidase SurE [Chlamydiae bacterium]|nr:5'/3'-nucleotidase SurE [Chlamydiota bacterium]
MQNNRPFILLTNDDGIHAPGIKHLWKALGNFADIAIVAPSTEKSGSALSTTMFSPLHILPVKWENDTPAWSITGTPADCVKIATSVVLSKKPDFILSGINQGSNAGTTVLYSGTIGGVIEGIYKNIPGIAFSCEDFYEPNFSDVEKYIRPIVDHFIKNPLPSGSFLNVNFPCKSQKIKGFKMAVQGISAWQENPDIRKHPKGHNYCWTRGIWKIREDELKNSDVALLKEGYITAVPIQIQELTDHKIIASHKESFEEVFSNIL